MNFHSDKLLLNIGIRNVRHRNMLLKCSGRYSSVVIIGKSNVVIVVLLNRTTIFLDV